MFDRRLSDLFDLTGRSAVVTGAANGIGAATARRLTEAGARVTLTDIDDAAGQKLAADLGPTASYQHCDISDTAQLISAADAAAKRTGSIDIWINNAGIFPTTGPLLDVTDDFLNRMFDVNIRSQFSAAREAANRMNGKGVIVNLASITAFRGGSNISAYSVSKHAVVGLTRSLAAELGPRGIRAVAVAPSAVETPGVDAQMAPLKAAGIDLGAMLSANPLGLSGHPDYVARVITFLVSDLAEFVTGVVIPVDGGTLA